MHHRGMTLLGSRPARGIHVLANNSGMECASPGGTNDALDCLHADSPTHPLTHSLKASCSVTHGHEWYQLSSTEKKSKFSVSIQMMGWATIHLEQPSRANLYTSVFQQLRGRPLFGGQIIGSFFKHKIMNKMSRWLVYHLLNNINCLYNKV